MKAYQVAEAVTFDNDGGFCMYDFKTLDEVREESEQLEAFGLASDIPAVVGRHISGHGGVMTIVSA